MLKALKGDASGAREPAVDEARAPNPVSLAGDVLARAAKPPLTDAAEPKTEPPDILPKVGGAGAGALLSLVAAPKDEPDVPKA